MTKFRHAKKREKTRKKIEVMRVRRHARCRREVRRVPLPWIPSGFMRESLLQINFVTVFIKNSFVQEFMQEIYVRLRIRLARRAGVRRIQSLRAFRRPQFGRFDVWSIAGL